MTNLAYIWTHWLPYEPVRFKGTLTKSLIISSVAFKKISPFYVIQTELETGLQCLLKYPKTMFFTWQNEEILNIWGSMTLSILKVYTYFRPYGLTITQSKALLANSVFYSFFFFQLQNADYSRITFFRLLLKVCFSQVL